MKLNIAAIVLTLFPSLTFANSNELDKLKCQSLLMGSSLVQVSGFVEEMVTAYSRLKDLPKYIDTAGSILRINPQAKVQLENLRRTFRGTSDTLDEATKNFRARLTTDSLERRWQALDGWEVRDLTLLNNELLMYGRVVGEKHGVLLVALPPTEILWEKADEVPMQFYYVGQIEYASNEPQDVFHGLNQVGPLVDAKIRELNEIVHTKVALSGKPFRNPKFNLNFRDETGVFTVERSLFLYRGDALRNPALSQLLSVFN